MLTVYLALSGGIDTKEHAYRGFIDNPRFPKRPRAMSEPTQPTVYLAHAGPVSGISRYERAKIRVGDDDPPTVYLATDPNAARGQRLTASRVVDDPTVYLGTQVTVRTDRNFRAEDPTVYLAHLPGAPCDHAVVEPNVYLAHSPDRSPQGEGANNMAPSPTDRRAALTGKVVSEELRPPLLLSYAYVKKFIAEQARYRYRQWVLDSGAFTVWKTGGTINLDEYTAFCKDRLAADPTLAEVFALDVIGDWRASVRNAEAMWAAGVPAIPTFHYGSPEDVLVGIARDYPKIALGGMVGLRATVKKAFFQQCFARVWPKPVHGFGIGTRAHILDVPWHSVDATNWEAGPCRYGRWSGYSFEGRGGAKLNVRGSQHDLRVEIRNYADIERLARHRWKREMVTIGDQLRAAGWRGYTEGGTP